MPLSPGNSQLSDNQCLTIDSVVIGQFSDSGIAEFMGVLISLYHRGEIVELQTLFPDVGKWELKSSFCALIFTDVAAK